MCSRLCFKYSASSVSAMAPPAPPAGHAEAVSSSMFGAHSPNTPSRAEGLDFGAAVRGNTAGIQIEEDILPQHPSMESGISMTLDQDDGRRDSHLKFQNTLKNLFEADGAEPMNPTAGAPVAAPAEPQGLPPPMDYVTKGGDDSADDEEPPIPAPATKGSGGATGHYAEPSTDPMNEEMKVDSGHIAAVSSVSSVGFHSNYDSLYGRGMNQTAGYQGHRTSNISTDSWKE